MSRDPEFEAMLDDLFHGCAFAAYVEEAVLAQGPPESEGVRIRAFRYYEEALKERNSKDREVGLIPSRK